MGDQITGGDFCGLCGSLLSSDEEVTCMKCDEIAMGAMARGSKMKRSRGVSQLDQSGCTIKRFNSMSEASKKTGIDISGISRAAAGVVAAAGGYNWSYK